MTILDRKRMNYPRWDIPESGPQLVQIDIKAPNSASTLHYEAYVKPLPDGDVYTQFSWTGTKEEC